MSHHTIYLIRILLIGWLAATSTFAAPPDLTGAGVIAGINHTDTYNLGATGLRGWIWVDGDNKGDTGLSTDQSRQILVTHCVAPASAVLAVNDVILGAIAANTGTVPNFSTDCRKAFASAITNAEKTGAGTLRVKRWRAGVITDQNITLSMMGNYSATAPFNCPKSTLILDNLRNKMVADLLANPQYLREGFRGATDAIALLSGVKPGDPDYATVQTRLQTYARTQAAKGSLANRGATWSLSYMLIYLSEYYLLTNDAQVLSGIQDYTLSLAEAQSIYGTYGHGSSAIRPDASGRRVSSGYGPINAVGGTAAIALVMGKKALVAASQPIDPAIDAAIQRSSGFFAYFVNKGSTPYGEHEPSTSGHGSNGKDAMPAIFFALQSGRAAETEFFSRLSIAGWIGREYGHTGQGLSYYWSTLGALMGGPDAASEHLKQVRWHLDLSRRTDGSFAYDGQEQYGPGTTSDNTYLGPAEYNGAMKANAMYLLTYSIPLKRLWITGKNANPAYTLDSTKIASAVAAGSFRLERGNKTIAQLFTFLGDYDPIVRNYAAIELSIRSLSGTDLTNLRNLLSNSNPILRSSACQTLGLLQDATALPYIVARLNDTDLWVRAKAAIAIRAYPSTIISTHRDAMMSSFITNATNPDVIDWTDPLQMSNGKLSLALFGNGVGDGTLGNNIASYTINAPKQSLLYPALRAALKQPDSYPRLGAIQFSNQHLSLADTQAIYTDIEYVAAYDTPADRMWSNDCRDQAITLLANLKIADGITLAISMLETPFPADAFGWGSATAKIAALKGLAAYGDAARYSLPTLKNYLNQWEFQSAEYNELLKTIASIENAITAPAQTPGLCVATQQIITTTGSIAITLSGSSPRDSFSYINVTQPTHGTLTGTAPNLTYTPTVGYVGPDQFTFQTKDTLTTSTVAMVSIIVGPSGNGIKGEYFNNANFTSPVLHRIDPQINFNWGAGSPHASVGADTFSTRWSGVLLVPQSGNYTFSALTSDGVRLYINGKLIIDRFVDQSTHWTDSSPIYLIAGQYAEVYMEYYENAGDAVAKLKWTGPNFAGANGNIIPQAYLFDGSGISNRPTYAFSQSLLTNQNTSLPILLNGSGTSLSYTILTQPTNGTLSGTIPNLTYTPNTNFSGNDSFTFLVNNGTTHSLPATISINVQAGSLSSFTWAGAVSGNWNDSSKWTPGLPNATGQAYYALNFTSDGTYTTTHNLNNDFKINQLNTIGNITLNGTQSISFVANGGSLPQFNENGDDTVTINHSIALGAMTTLGGTGGGSFILNGVISGTGGLIKNSPNRLQIGQITNSFSGGIVLNAGAVILPSGNSENPISPLGSGTITINTGALLAIDRTNLANNMIFNGGTVSGANGFPSIFSGSIILNGIATFDFGHLGNVGISGNISGPGGLIYTGPSDFPCSGNNTYTGSTTILTGILSYPSINSVPPGPLILSANGKVKLNYIGTRIIDSLTLNGAFMPPGTYGSTASPATNKNDTYFIGNGTITILPPTSTSLNLSTGSSPANPGTALTFTATVTGITPTGNIQFYSGSTLLGTSSLNGSYTATLTTTQLAIGSNSITARYEGNANNKFSASPAVVVEVRNEPTAAPTGLSATLSGSAINLTWTAPPGANNYYVKRSTTNGGPYAVITFTASTSYTDNTILNGVPYYYVVSTINAAKESPNSNQASAGGSIIITYNGNGHTGGVAPSNQSKTQDVNLTLATNSGNLTKTGFTFTGWNTAANGTGTNYAAGATYTANTAITLYAKWNAIPVANAGPDQAVTLSAIIPWSPITLGPQLWLDANDTNTITLNGATVSQWNDKSSFGRHATQSTSTAQPTATPAGLNGKRVITFDGNSDALNVDLNFLAGTSHSAFIVTKPTIYNNIYGAANGNQGANSLHVGFAPTGNYRMNYWGNDFGLARTANFIAGSANIMNYNWLIGTSKQILANGKSEGISTSPLPGAIGTMSGGGRIGNVVGTGFFGGDIAEVIIINGSVNNTDRQKIEGYLAHKWELTANLATDHPYKNTPPAGSGAIATINLDGTATDSDSLTTTWSVSSGPASVTFANTAAIDTTATFTFSGTYTLRLTANDGFAQVSDNVVITVSNAPSYQTWTDKTFSNIFTDRAITSDPDGDNLTNLQEFAFGMDPTSSSSAPLSYVSNGTTSSGIPILENTGTPSSPSFRAVFARRKNHATEGISYEVQFSANLQYWKASSDGMTVLSGTSSSDVEAVSVPFPTTVPTTAAETEFVAPKFFRIAVSEN